MEGVIPSGRAFHSSCLIEGKNVIVIYGGILQNQEVSNDLIVYDIPRRMFYPIKNEMNIISNNNLIYPKLFGHTIKRIDQQLFILGGLQDFSCLCKYYYKFQLDNESDKNKAKDHTLILNERDILLDTEAAVNSMKNILIINLNL